MRDGLKIRKKMLRSFGRFACGLWQKPRPLCNHVCYVCVVQGGGADTGSTHAQRVGGRVAVPSGGAAHGQAVRGRVRLRGRRAGQLRRSGRGVRHNVGGGRGGRGEPAQRRDGDRWQESDGTAELRRDGRRRRRRRRRTGDGVAVGAEPQRLCDRQRAERVQCEGARGRSVPVVRQRRHGDRVGELQGGAGRGRLAQVGVQQLQPVADDRRRRERPPAPPGAHVHRDGGRPVQGQRVVAVVAAVRQYAVPRQHASQPVRGVAAQAASSAAATQAEARAGAAAAAVGAGWLVAPQDRGRGAAAAVRPAVHRHTRVERHHGHRVHQLGHSAAVVRHQHRPRQEQFAVPVVRGGRAGPGRPHRRQHAVRLDPAGQAVLLPERPGAVRRRALRAPVRRRLPDHVLRVRRVRPGLRRRGWHHGRHHGRHARRGAAILVLRHLAVLQRAHAAHRTTRGRLHI